MEQVNAKKSPLKASDALALVEQATQIYAAKGKHVVHVDLRKQRPDDAALLQLLLGPTGNLRAPTLRVGTTLIVGFDAATYEKILGKN